MTVYEIKENIKNEVKAYLLAHGGEVYCIRPEDVEDGKASEEDIEQCLKVRYEDYGENLCEGYLIGAYIGAEGVFVCLCATEGDAEVTAVPIDYLFAESAQAVRYTLDDWDR